jgi:large subunit ribosomal protein L17
MLRGLVSDLINHERLQTTDAKAKELRRIAEKMITLGKRGDLHARRLAARTVQDKAALQKLFEVLGPRYEERNGGYTRVVKLGYRKGDDAPISLVELVDSEYAE